MKKVFYSMLLAMVLFAAGTTAKAQTATLPLKIGYFDFDQMVQAMPGYAKVDSALQLYAQDSLQQEYQFYQEEFQRLDSTFKADSAKGKAKTVLDQIAKQRQQVGINIVYWQQIQQNKVEAKRQQLAAPLMDQVATAYRKVLEATKVTLVLKPSALEYGTNEKSITNLLVLVAKELKIPMQQQQQPGGDDDQQQQQPATRPQGGAAKPKQ